MPIDRRALMLGLAAPAFAQALMPLGSSRMTFAEPSAGGEMAIWLHRPAAWRPGGAVLAVLHGASRNADGYRDVWAPIAEARGALLVCPEFSQAQYPGAEAYNEGRARGLPRAQWSFHALPRAVAAARRAAGEDGAGGYLLYGHSAGSQFAHRTLLLCGGLGATRMVAANAGFYSWPDLSIAYPYGLGGLDLDAAALRAALAFPLTVLLGEADIDPQDPQLRRSPTAMRQGPHRLERGRNFHAAAMASGMPCAWGLSTVPGVAHSNAGMAQRAAAVLFG
jgi:poly(3-hydroxybutyrate) depolymerase